MDFLPFDKSVYAKKNGLRQPQQEKDIWFGMLFETVDTDFQYAFVGTAQWELFKQHCVDRSAWRPTPTDLLKTLPPRWALFLKEKHDLGEEWACQYLDQDITDVFDNGLMIAYDKSPVEAVFKAWLLVNKIPPP